MFRRIAVPIVLLFACECTQAQQLAEVRLLTTVSKPAPCGVLYNVMKVDVELIQAKDKILARWDTVSFLVECPADFPRAFWTLGNMLVFKYEYKPKIQTSHHKNPNVLF